jgi:hypothetical protein
LKDHTASIVIWGGVVEVKEGHKPGRDAPRGVTARRWKRVHGGQG